MKDYRPLLSNVANLLEELIDVRKELAADNRTAIGDMFSYSIEDVETLLEGLQEVIIELDDEYN